MSSELSVQKLDRWRAESMRLTAFPMSGELVKDEWWKPLLGDEPERVEINRLTGIEESGRFGTGRLTLKRQVRRIDWKYIPFDPKAMDLPEIGPLVDALALFRPLMAGWLANAPPLLRLAFGMEVFIPTENLAAGYATLRPYLPDIRVPTDGISDLIFQINRPRSSHIVPQQTINRLSKWSVVTWAKASVIFQPDSAHAGLHHVGTGLNLEVDINTAGSSDAAPLTADRLPALWDELVDHGVGIVAEGDHA